MKPELMFLLEASGPMGGVVELRGSRRANLDPMALSVELSGFLMSCAGTAVDRLREAFHRVSALPPDSAGDREDASAEVDVLLHLLSRLVFSGVLGWIDDTAEEASIALCAGEPFSAEGPGFRLSVEAVEEGGEG